MSSNPFTACIDACNRCAVACNTCSAACLQEPDVQHMARCIALDIDCAAMCQFAAGAMARNSAHAKAICQLCADICQACGDECAQHSAQHCQDCAAACHACAKACAAMAR